MLERNAAFIGMFCSPMFYFQSVFVFYPVECVFFKFVNLNYTQCSSYQEKKRWGKEN